MNELVDNAFKLLVLVVAVCVALRLAYDVVHPALPFIGVLVIVAAGLWFWRWWRDRW